jgi:hypothetical protein
MKGALQIDRDAPKRFLRTAFLPDDWIAMLLKCHDTGEAVQRVGPVGMFLDDRFQGWLRFKNARRFSVFLGVNRVTPGRRSRTRESIGAVRHVFLDADQDADLVLSVIAARPDLPVPSYVLRSSRGRAHVMWRVDGFDMQRAEVLQKHLARELGTDVAATSAAQLTRLPGLFNHKYRPAPLVKIDYYATSCAYEPQDFLDVSAQSAPKAPAARRDTQRREGMPMVRVRRTPSFRSSPSARCLCRRRS